MTVSRDFVNHNKWLWCKIDTRNGKSVTKKVRIPILTLKCEMLWLSKGLKKLTRLLRKNAIGW